jgi:beta-lactam-binding protein with PASTA domain
LDLATVAAVAVPNVNPEEVVAQVPPPDARDVTSPAVSLLLSQQPSASAYVMPNFVGHQLAEAKAKISKAGLQLASVEYEHTEDNNDSQTELPPPLARKVPISGKIAKQSPPPGSRVTAETQIKLEVEQ